MIVGVQSNDALTVWPRVAKYFQSFSDRTKGRTTVAELFKGVLEKKRQMWIAIIDNEVKACALTEIETDSGCVVLNFCSGEGREEWQHEMVEEIMAWTKSMGLYLVILHRPGWRPLLKDMGFKMTHMMSEMEL
jgi:hypothetical protein